MAILKISHMGHPVLRKVTRHLTAKEIQSSFIKNLIKDMWETLEDSQGVGLAAPQVFHDLSLAIIGAKKQRYTKDAIKPQVIFNASYRPLNDESIGVYEGCLSIPEIRAYVPRYKKIEVSFVNIQGKKQKRLVEGFEAIVFQHEIDHLHGILYLDRCEVETLTFEKEYERFHA